MEFINSPQPYNHFRTDYCTSLKGENGECISINILEQSSRKSRLIIKLNLPSDRSSPHYFKLFHLGKRERPNEAANGEISFLVKPYQKEIKLDFFGIRKATKDQAKRFITDHFPSKDPESIIKQNCSSVVLVIELVNDQEQKINSLSHELCVGKIDKNQIIIKHCTPRCLYDNGEITFLLGQKIDDEMLNLEVTSIDKQYCRKYKSVSHPAPNVFVFTVKYNEIPGGSFQGQLLVQENRSIIKDFFIREKEADLLKRKTSSVDENCSTQVKILKYDSCSESESGPVDVSLTSKRRLSSLITTKWLRVIARAGHDFAFGKPTTNKMLEIMHTVPVVCILQDDVKDTPLNNAILKDQEKRADYLLDIIIKNFPYAINLANTSGHTALILSPACNMSVGFVKKLIDNGADLMATDEDGNTAFNIAIQYRRSDVFELLMNEAKSRELLRNAQELIVSLIKDILNDEYREGFEILFTNFSIFFDIQLVLESLSKNQIKLYKEYETDNLVNNNFCEFTPIQEINFEQLLGDVQDLNFSS